MRVAMIPGKSLKEDVAQQDMEAQGVQVVEDSTRLAELPEARTIFTLPISNGGLYVDRRIGRQSSFSTLALDASKL